MNDASVSKPAAMSRALIIYLVTRPIYMYTYRKNSCLCLLFKIMQHQVHVPTNDILDPLLQQDHHTKEIYWLHSYASTSEVCKYSFFPHSFSMK